MLRRRRSLLDLDDVAVDMRKPLIATSLMSFYTSTVAIAQFASHPQEDPLGSATRIDTCHNNKITG